MSWFIYWAGTGIGEATPALVIAFFFFFFFLLPVQLQLLLQMHQCRCPGFSDMTCAAGRIRKFFFFFILVSGCNIWLQHGFQIHC